MDERRYSPEEIYKAVNRLPVLSPNALKLVQLISQSDYEVDDVIKIVTLDTGLTSQILRVVNSPVYNLMKPVQSVERAVVILGEQIIVGIALRYIANHLFDKDLPGYNSQGGDLWSHDLRVAIASREIARLSGYELGPDLAFTAGLLHDIGKVVIADFLNNSADYILNKIQNAQFMDYLKAEDALLGTNHAKVGYVMAKEWSLPASLQMAIRYHHEPAQATYPYNLLVYIVHLADILAMMEGWGTGSDTMQYELDRGYANYIKLTFEDITDIMLQVEEEFRSAEQAFE